MRAYGIAFIALGLGFILGFLAEGFGGSGDRFVWVLGLVLLPAAVALICRNSRRDVAPLIGGAILFGALITGSFGAYFAAQVGWRGLEPGDFGSDDIPARWMLLLYM